MRLDFCLLGSLLLNDDIPSAVAERWGGFGPSLSEEIRTALCVGVELDILVVGLGAQI
jgi:hypothetical protein